MKTGAVSMSGGRYLLPEYPFRRPPELDEEGSQSYPVVVVGAGLAGLTAACALAQLGVSVVVLDEDHTVGARGASSRGICYAQKSLEIFARLGIYERMLARGISWTVGRTFAGREQVFAFDFAREPGPADSRQPAFINIQQFYVESFLVERLSQLDVDLRWRSRVKGCKQDEQSITLDVETPAGSYPLRAEWVIDCSGAHSPLRETAGLYGHGAGGKDRWCICDVHFEHPPALERHTWIAAPFNDYRAAWQHVMADNVCRVDYQLSPDGLDPATVTHAPQESFIRERLARQFGPEARYEIVWSGTWTYRSRCLDKFRMGRLLFAGDAAHVMSPFGGRGGNSAIQDADNLAWKIAMVLSHRASSRLLDSYTQERRAAAGENIRISDRTARFLCPASSAERLLRDAVLSLARRFPFARALVNTGRMSQPSVYVDSGLNVGQAGGRSLPNFPLQMPDGSPGDLAQLMRWAHGNFLAIVRGPITQLVELERRYPVRIIAAERLGAGAAALDAVTGVAAAAAIVLRPDHYCAGCLPTGGKEALEKALRTLLGFGG